MNPSEIWENASLAKKRFVMIGGALAAFIILGSFITFMDRNRAKPKPVKSTESSTVMMPSRKNTDMEGLAATTVSTQRRLQQIESDHKADKAGVAEQIKQLRELIVSRETGSGEMSDIKGRLDSLAKRLDEAPPAQRSTVPPQRLPPIDKVLPRDGVPAPVLGGAGNGEIPGADTKPVVPEMKLRVIGGNSSSGSNSSKTSADNPHIKSAAGSKSGGVNARDLAEKAPEKDSDTSYLPMGALIQGVLLNGMDAPTSGAAQKNPTPALIRIKHDAILPNRARYDIRECFVIASGYGVMSTERAVLRTEGISCVREDGGVVETNLSGYIIGEDGKVGMRGRLVSKQGAVIAQSLVAGVLSGVGKALTPTGVTGINLNPSTYQQTQTVDPSTSLEAGLLNGTATTLNQISKFYLDIAKEMVPIVEIDAGRPVIIVLTRGAALRMSK